MFDGPPPIGLACTDADHDRRDVGDWLRERIEQGCAPSKVAVFTRSAVEIKRARATVKAGGARAVELSEKVEIKNSAVPIGTLSFAKGLEFRSVLARACDDNVIPQSERIESVADDAELEEVSPRHRRARFL